MARDAEGRGRAGDRVTFKASADLAGGPLRLRVCASRAQGEGDERRGVKAGAHSGVVVDGNSRSTGSLPIGKRDDCGKKMRTRGW